MAGHMVAGSTVPIGQTVPDFQIQHGVEQYLYREANLLDSRDLEAWEALFAPGGMYWVPLVHEQTDPLNHASLFWEDAVMRDVRRRRLDEARAWSQQPLTRASRVVGNVMIVSGSLQDGAITVRSSFQMTEWRKRREQRQLAGHYRHELVLIDGDWRIALKRIDLINCDAIHDCFEIFL